MLRVGVIGVGSMGQNHARVFSEIADLVGVVDKDRETGKIAAERFNTESFENYEDLLKKGVDAVSIATPTALHYQVSKDAMEAGVHVLVEKPMCSTIEEAEKLVELAESAGLTLAVGHIERHNPVVDFAKKGIRDGRYGDVITISARRVSSLPTRIRDVGVILDLGIHDIDVMRYLLGSEVASVFASGGRIKHESFEDHANIMLSFENGTSGLVEVNWLTPMKVRRLSLTGLKNFVEIDYITQSIWISSSSLGRLDSFNLYRIPLEFDTRKITLEMREPLKNELTDFMDAIEKKRDPLISGRDGLGTLKAVMAAIESQKSGKRIDL
ncbi:MAG: Gfo/Idh/MocA family oxidoreductase [Thermoplasmata archaeon]|nr:Gfo/Idh/MocA family oxidoreductase [Thermoplasmata archaeon]